MHPNGGRGMADFGWKNMHEKELTNKLKRKIETILSSAIRHLQTSVLLIIHTRGQFIFLQIIG